MKKARAIVVLSLAVAAGCGGSAVTQSPSLPQTPQAAPATLQFVAGLTAAGITPSIHRITGASWIRPDAGKQWLLYTSELDTGTVKIYNYRSKPGHLYGQITGFTLPAGECVDTSGNVYVVDSGSGRVYQFAHGATTPSHVVADQFGYPDGCVVDRATGNLIVANGQGLKGPFSHGGIDIFAGGITGPQSNYKDRYFDIFWPPGIDPNGNIFFEWKHNANTQYGIAELPKGATKFRHLTGLTIGFSGSVQWDGSYIAAEDQQYQGAYTTAISRITVNGSTVSVIGTTVLSDNCMGSFGYTSQTDVVQPLIYGIGKTPATLLGSNLWCYERFGFWKYPAGGQPRRALPPDIAPVYSFGQAVSPP
jgi:hypothetical protein